MRKHKNLFLLCRSVNSKDLYRVRFNEKDDRTVEQWKAGSGGPLQSPPLSPPGSFDLFSNLNGTIKDDFSEFDNLRTSKKAGT